MEQYEYYTSYDGLEELNKLRTDLAEELLDNRSKPDVETSDNINVYEDLETYAEYEVVEGWYASAIDKDLTQIDYHGAPNLSDFIDYEKLGQALYRTWDAGVYYLASTGEVIEFY